MNPQLQYLPGGDLIEKGLNDLKQKMTTVESCLVQIASPQLVRAKLLEQASTDIDTELTLYRLLQQKESNPYSTYNSLLRTLSSFERALFS